MNHARIFAALWILIAATQAHATEVQKPTEDQCILRASDAYGVCSEKFSRSQPDRLACMNRVSSARDLCKSGNASLQQITAAATGD